jgi:MSHA biogenesis protein MshI
MQIAQLLKVFKRISREVGWVSIIFGRHGVHFVRLKRTADKVEVLLCEFHALENVTSSELEKLVKELDLGTFQFTTLLAPDEYQILLVDAPNVPAEELKTAVRFRIKDSLSYHVDEAAVDVLLIPGNANSGNRPQSLFAVAASNDTLKKRISLFEKAKINLNVIDIPEMAQRNIAALFETEGRGLALLSFDERGGLLTFTSGGELYLARRLDVTSGQLLDANENTRQQYVERVELEIQRSMDYFDRQFHYITLGKMLVSAPEGAGLVQLFANSLGLPVEAINLAGVLDISATPALLNNDFVTEALPAVGAALRQERRKL